MFDSEIKVKIDFDSRPESNDPENLSMAIFVLQDIRKAFEKVGGCYDDEILALRDAENILAKVSRCEVFWKKENKL